MIGISDRNKKWRKNLKNQERKYQVEVSRKVSKNANGGYLMGMQKLNLPKSKKQKKQKMKKKHKNWRKLKMKKREMLAWKRVPRFT